jgi:spore coat polysaccharide biosynthesis protein SpsF
MRTVGIIQARNGNDRLPNKGSIELLGKPMLQHVIERVKRAKRLDDVVVAIPGAPEDNVLLVTASVALANSFCGRPYDIADADLAKRYFTCARDFKADLIVRICADNPCIEPEAIDLLIEHGNLGVDNALVTNAGDYRVAGKDFGWPDGIGAELYNMKMLEFLNFEVSKPELREHPHKYYHNTHNVIVPPCPKDWWRPGLRLDVNTQEDFEYIETIYNYFGDNNFHIAELLVAIALQEHWTKKT